MATEISTNLFYNRHVFKDLDFLIHIIEKKIN